MKYQEMAHSNIFKSFQKLQFNSNYLKYKFMSISAHFFLPSIHINLLTVEFLFSLTFLYIRIKNVGSGMIDAKGLKYEGFNYFVLSQFPPTDQNLIQFNTLHLKRQMLRIATNQRVLPIKRKTPSLSSVDNLKRSKHSKIFDGQKKIPLIINELEQNLNLLKKYYYEDKVYLQSHNSRSTSKRPSKASSSHLKQRLKKSSEDQGEEETTTVAEIDDLKKSFLSMHGYDTNNIVELYNFYKKNLQKSTRLFGSTSMSNMINLTQNQSEIREKCPRLQSAFVALNQQSIKQKQQRQGKAKKPEDKPRLPQIQGQGLLKKSTQMVSVATLLAEKKKISRKNICENMNSEHLINQAKKKLYRPHPNENIQRISKLKQNIKNENIRISPGRKLRNIESIKEKSSSKKSNRKENKQEVVNNSINYVNKDEKLINALSSGKTGKKQKNIEKDQQPVVVVNFTTEERPETKHQELKPIVSPAIKQQEKELKSAKSSRSVRSIKSPNSIRSPSLNQAVLLDLTISGDPSSKKKQQPSYFVPKVHTSSLHDSLLDCEITPKEQSKILDLDSIPFDF